MAVDDRIQVRIDHATKALAEKKLKEQGLTLSEYTRMMVANAAYGGVVVQLQTPNDRLNSAVQEAANYVTGKEQLEGFDSIAELEKHLQDE